MSASVASHKTPQTSLYDYNRFLEALIDCEDLTVTAHRVGKLIAKGFRADWGYCCYSIDQMAGWLKVTAKSVWNAVEALKKSGLINVNSRPNRRNHYVPIFVKKVTNPSRKSLRDGITKKFTSSTIEKSSDSLRESSSSLETTNEPIARRQDRRAEADSVLVAEGEETVPKAQNWVEFRNHVLERWRLPKGWDRWAFEKSVMKFEHKVRREDAARWRGLPLANLRLLKWLKRERYHTQHAFDCRSSDEWIDYEE